MGHAAYRAALTISVVAALFLGSATADELITRAEGLLKSRQAQEAYGLLDAQLLERAGEADFDYLLGIAALDSGRPAVAVLAFERVLAVQPGHVNARAELARAHLALGEQEAARREFEAVLKMDLPHDVRDKVRRFIAQLDAGSARRAVAGRDMKGFIEATVGYDSNINSGTEDEVVNIPLFGNQPFRLARIAVEGESPFQEIRGGFQATDTDGAVTFYAALNGAFRYHNDFSGYWPNSLDGTLGFQWDHGRNVYNLGLTTYRYSVNEYNLDAFYGLLGQWQHTLDPYNQIDTYVTIQDQNHPEAPNLDTTLYLAGTTWKHRLQDTGLRLALTGYLGSEEEAGNDPTVGRDFYGLRLGLDYRVNGKASIHGKVGVQKSNYGGTDVFFLEGRDDTRWDASISGRYYLDKFWSVRPKLSFTDNDSDIVTHDFDRTQVMLSVRRDLD